MGICIEMRWVIPEGTSTELRILQFAVFERGHTDEEDRVVQDWTTVRTHCVKHMDYVTLLHTGALPQPPKDSQ